MRHKKIKLLLTFLLVALAIPLARADELTVANGTSTNAYAPVHSSYLDGVGSTYQVIYPATELADLSGSNITGVKFYASGNLNFTGGSLQVSVGETANTTFSSATAITGLDVFATTAVSSTNDEFVLNFDNEYPYNGGNLVIEIKVLTAVTLNGYSTMNWYGTSASGNNVYYYDSGYYSNSGTQSWLPKTTFTYEVASTEPYAAKVTPSELAFGGIAVGGTKSMDVTLKNTGVNAFTPSVSVSGTGFSTTYTATEIASKGTVTIPVTFNPTAVGDFTGTLTINCGEAGTFTVDLTGSASLNLTLCDGSDTNDYLPIYGYYYDSKQINQMIYPASMLSGIVGKKIKSLTFYTTNEYFSGGKYNVSIGVTDQSTFAAPITRLTGLTLVASDLVAVSGAKEITINFDEPFAYAGNNLVIDFEVTETGSYGSSRTYFQGVNQSTNTSFHSYGNSVNSNGVYNTSANARQFLPKVKIGYEEAGPTPVITVDPATVEAFSTEVGTPVTATVNVTGENLTDAITATVSGDDAFSAVLENGVVTITYNPATAGNHTATLTLSSTGAQNVTVALTGTATAPAAPTITVNPATLNISAALGETKTATFTVTGANLEGDITVTASEGFTVEPATIAATDGAASATVTVTYVAPATAETKTGTITLTSEGAETKTVDVNATAADITYDFTVDEAETGLDFGEVYVGQSKTVAVTIRNNGNDNINPVFTFNNNVFTVEDDSYPVYGGVSQTYNIIYTPAAVGTDNGVLTVTVGSQSLTVNLTGKGAELAAYDIASSAASGVHNYGDVFKDGIGTWNITLTNNGVNAVTPVIEGLEAPFAAENVPATLAAGESATITITFAPTEIKAYGPTSIVVKFNETEDFQFDYTLRGNGIENTGTLPPSTYDNYTYTWTDDEGAEHISTVSEIATDPNQMIALLKEVYTNKNLPGNYYRGYKADGTVDTDHPVAYPAIGQITVDKNYNTEFLDAYGWGMNHDENAYPTQEKVVSTTANEHRFYYMNPNEYKPNQEGLTLLLVEMNDGVGASTTTTKPTDYASLKNLYSKMFKSVRVIPNSKRVSKDGIEGTLFKVDCDKMNRFFFLAKGRLRFYDEHEQTGGLGASAYARATKKLSGSGAGNVSTTSVDRENSIATVNPFNAMYEQFSPVSLSSGEESSDVYQLLINMENYDVEHDCESIPWASTTGTTGTVTGHEFNMYGKTSISADCQDVRDLMFFVPDQRMMYYSGRDKGASDMFVNYYKQYAPNMGMYVIRQNDITGEQIDGQDTYKLHLTWDSNLTDFVPAADGVYYIYQVNEDGTYTPVGSTDSQTKELYLDVDMQEHGQQVTYVIQGQDNTGFLSLQFSNEESFIIPGLDPYEKFQLDPKAEIYSRYNPVDEHNYYANGLQVKGYADATTDMFVGKTINFFRKPVTGTTEGEWLKVFAVNATSATAATITESNDQRAQADYIYGYKQNPSAITISADKVFDVIFDNFKAEVGANDHADLYRYMMVVDGTPADAEKYHSNQITVKVYKTAMSPIDGVFTKEQVDNDLSHAVNTRDAAFDIDVEHSSKTDILRYSAYRWDEEETPAILTGSADAEEDISPSGQASNQGEYYSVYMNGDSFIGQDVYVAQGETGKAAFVDDVPAKATEGNLYTYAPVVETFTGRADYNTYGAPQQHTATGVIKAGVDEGTVEHSQYEWPATNPQYTYYNVWLKVSATDIPEGYDLYKVRAWRKAPADMLAEELEQYQERLGNDGEYLFDEMTYDADEHCSKSAIVGFDLGSEQKEAKVWAGTFGAKILAAGETMPLEFTLRAYFTRNANLAGRLASPREATVTDANGYYITETKVNYTLVGGSVITAVRDLNREVKDVTYYNMTGAMSKTPFEGINVVVTRYSDGSTSTRKVVR